MMTAVILGCGPSLASLAATPAAGLVIGVNRAALIHRCDWWAVGDWQAFLENDPLGTPAVFTSEESLRVIAGSNYARLSRHKVKTFESVDDPPRELWALFSTLAAIGLAYHLGAMDITLYGADMKGEADYDGHTLERNTRTAARWANERARLETLAAWLKDHGAELHGTP